jgi:hypothetical protein
LDENSATALRERTAGKGWLGRIGVNHVGFIVNNVQEQTAKWKTAGVPVLAGQAPAGGRAC